MIIQILPIESPKGVSFSVIREPDGLDEPEKIIVYTNTGITFILDKAEANELIDKLAATLQDQDIA